MPSTQLNFKDWCSNSETAINGHQLNLLSDKENRLEIGIGETAKIVPNHYVAEEQISHVFDRLGKKAAAEKIKNKLPIKKHMRSADLGEIYATEWINAHCEGYDVPIKRLRWKDSSDMAMRGDDVIAIKVDSNTKRLRFLKSEAKSRKKLSEAVLTEARDALDKDNGKPSPHTLSFISERLFELGCASLADAIDDEMLKHGILIQNVSHLMFTFSGNNPEKLLAKSLKNYQGNISQISVGLQVKNHQEFIGSVYNKVIKNGYVS